MKNINLILKFSSVLIVIILQGCAAPKAADFSDDWKPINILSPVAAEIPLKEELELHRFQMLPTDTSLRFMLERWSKENGGELEWQLPSDLTLVSALEGAKDNNLQRALNVVRRSYDVQKIRIQVLPNKNIQVSRAP